jgi:pimeloyl-ACP methyl ester carboxylesterase
MRLGGCVLHYYHQSRRGSQRGTPILLVHGIADSATTWADVVGPLSALGDVYALDLPGFGFSTPPPGSDFVPLRGMVALLEAFLREVIGQPAVLVGNSMGAWMGLSLATARPELLRAVIAINPGGAPLGGRESWQPFVDMASVPDLRAVRMIYQRMFARHQIRLPLYIGQHGFRQLFSARAVQRLLNETSEDDFLAVERVCGINVPVGVLWGADDRFLPDGSLEFFQQCLPHAAWRLLPATGHLPQVERPLAVVRFVRRFVRRLDASSRSARRPSRFTVLSHLAALPQLALLPHRLPRRLPMLLQRVRRLRQFVEAP